jgi:catalase
MAKKSPAPKNQPKKQSANASAPAVPRNGAFEAEGEFLTTNQGLRISDNHNSLKTGPRGSVLLEDFQLREKITSFDHERIPERVVHARGAGAFGYFEATEDMSRYTSAGVFKKGKRTPVLTRFSTVAGSRGSADTARDVRGFAVKFYTDEGNWDFVGNNIPVFFIQDAIKFPDLIHAVKPEQHNEIPQAQSAHDTFWDFVSLMPETTHMLTWVMSDRAVPRSYRMMEGFGVHTFRFVNAAGKSTFVKFHWKPVLGVHSIPWEESQQLGGLDPDFHRRDLFEAIDSGNPAQWDLGVQLIPEEDEMKFSFDLLDATKLVPEELVPVKIIGRMTLDRNPDNYFSEIEQVAFHPGHVVPGIDFSDDPLLAGRLFSYTDTQITRLGGPNFHEIPVNRPLANTNNNNRDGLHRQLVPKGRVAYEPNSLAKGCPFHAKADMNAFVSFTEKLSGQKVRARSKSFGDHFSQAALFYNSQNEIEKQHIKDAFSFELSHVETPAIRERMVNTLALVSSDLAGEVAKNLGLKAPKKGVELPSPPNPKNNIVPKNRASGIAEAIDTNLPTGEKALPADSKALSIMKNNKGMVETRKVAFLVNPKADQASVAAARKTLEGAGVVVELVSPSLHTPGGDDFNPDAERFLSSFPSHAYDGAYLFGPAKGYDQPKDLALAIRFLGQAIKHCKTVGVAPEAQSILDQATMGLFDYKGDDGMVTKKNGAASFLEALKAHRHWHREAAAKALPF